MAQKCKFSISHFTLRSISSMSAAKDLRKKQKFTPEEDEIIKQYVSQNGMKDWHKVAMMLPQRTGKQVRERYINYLSPNVSLLPWTDEEETLLINLVNSHGKRWSKFSIYLQNRTDIAIKNHWVNITRRIRKEAPRHEIKNIVYARMSKERTYEPPVLHSPIPENNFSFTFNEPMTNDITNQESDEELLSYTETLLWEDILNQDYVEYNWNTPYTEQYSL